MCECVAGGAELVGGWSQLVRYTSEALWLALSQANDMSGLNLTRCSCNEIRGKFLVCNFSHAKSTGTRSKRKLICKFRVIKALMSSQSVQISLPVAVLAYAPYKHHRCTGPLSS